MQNAPPKVITIGVIADTLGVTPDRVRQVLRKRRHIRPAAYAGNVRLFTSDTISHVRHELHAMDAKRQGVRR